MNGNYYQNPTFPTNQQPNVNMTVPPGNVSSMEDYNEQSYIENILRQNKGKKAKAYFSFTDSNAWRDKVFEGVIEEAGKDHLVMSDPSTGKWELILLIYLNYVEFDEAINYNKNYVDKY